MHRIPQLQHDNAYKENGISEFMSPEAFDFAWTQYQTLLVDKLNLLTQGESALPADISISNRVIPIQTQQNK